MGWGLAPWSRTVTVMVEVDAPSAGSLVDEGDTAELAAETAGCLEGHRRGLRHGDATAGRRVGHFLGGGVLHGEADLSRVIGG